MDVVFLAFSNSREDPLPSLKKEDETLYQLFLKRQQAGHLQIHRDSYATHDTLINNLRIFKDDVILFHFSGHAGDRLLYLDDRKLHGVGIAELLGQCPKLRLIVLNGCGTEDQVEVLSKIPSKPIIVSTQANVGDETATEFAIRFYQVLCESQGSVGQAFDFGLASAQALRRSPLEVQRGGYIPRAARRLWGIFHPSEADLNWKLPTTSQPLPAQDFTPNEFLIAGLLKAFADYDDQCAKIVRDEAIGVSTKLSKKKQHILRCLPHPVSEQLRKLMVPSTEGSAMTFYDKIGLARLRQLQITFQTVLELICFVSIAELWDYLAEEEVDLPLPLLTHLRTLFLADTSHHGAAFLYSIICATIDFLPEGRGQIFVADLVKIKSEFAADSSLEEICTYFDVLKDGLAQQDSEDLTVSCREAEEKLTNLLSRLAFIVNYTVVSVKDIDVIKYKHFKKPIFKHRLIKLVQTFVGLESEDEVLETYLDNSSVLLMEKGGASKKYLNLSPFIFDENAFIDKHSDDAKLRFFQNYIVARDVFWFKHVYKPLDVPLEVNQQQLVAIKNQFNAFAEKLFDQPLDQLA